MLSLPAGREASPGVCVYERHRPERTLLYQLVEAYYPAFLSQLAAQGTGLPGDVTWIIVCFIDASFLPVVSVV